MIRLICPSCSTEYEVEDTAIPEEGREVQCGTCQNSWHVAPKSQDTLVASEDIDDARPHAEALAAISARVIEEAEAMRSRAQHGKTQIAPPEENNPVQLSIDPPVRENLWDDVEADPDMGHTVASAKTVQQDDTVFDQDRIHAMFGTEPSEEDEALWASLRESARSFRDNRPESPTVDPVVPADSSSPEESPAESLHRRTREQNLSAETSPPPAPAWRTDSEGGQEIILGATPAAIARAEMQTHDHSVVSEDTAPPLGESLNTEPTAFVAAAPRRGGFSIGLITGLAMVLLAMGIYIFADPISRHVPQVAPLLTEYRAGSDQLRNKIRGQFGANLVSVHAK